MATKTTNNPTAATNRPVMMAMAGFVAADAAETRGADLYNSTLPPPPTHEPEAVTNTPR